MNGMKDRGLGHGHPAARRRRAQPWRTRAPARGPVTAPSSLAAVPREEEKENEAAAGRRAGDARKGCGLLSSARLGPATTVAILGGSRCCCGGYCSGKE
jgi:hypothetical protein